MYHSVQILSLPSIMPVIDRLLEMEEENPKKPIPMPQDSEDKETGKVEHQVEVTKDVVTITTKVN